ncbi:hypothetical protein L6164_033063 [Bauhinia variegata]|uniref:Uncharacterized protein n=1 Tax=Bauhinia variegata TaxID=167791 RepID=A0ACB9KR18_BAUVA|nr:hypothetical protein L6164_033063 [Bauhinia variegata]
MRLVILVKPVSNRALATKLRERREFPSASSAHKRPWSRASVLRIHRIESSSMVPTFVSLCLLLTFHVRFSFSGTKLSPI